MVSGASIKKDGHPIRDGRLFLCTEELTSKADDIESLSSFQPQSQNAIIRIEKDRSNLFSRKKLYSFEYNATYGCVNVKRN